MRIEFKESRHIGGCPIDMENGKYEILIGDNVVVIMDDDEFKILLEQVDEKVREDYLLAQNVVKRYYHIMAVLDMLFERIKNDAIGSGEDYNVLSIIKFEDLTPERWDAFQDLVYGFYKALFDKNSDFGEEFMNKNFKYFKGE